MIDYVGAACHGGCGGTLPKRSWRPQCAGCWGAALRREHAKLVEAFGPERAAEIAERTSVNPLSGRIAR